MGFSCYLIAQNSTSDIAFAASTTQAQPRPRCTAHKQGKRNRTRDREREREEQKEEEAEIGVPVVAHARDNPSSYVSIIFSALWIVFESITSLLRAVTLLLRALFAGKLYRSASRKRFTGNGRAYCYSQQKKSRPPFVRSFWRGVSSRNIDFRPSPLYFPRIALNMFAKIGLPLILLLISVPAIVIFEMTRRNDPRGHRLRRAKHFSSANANVEDCASRTANIVALGRERWRELSRINHLVLNLSAEHQ